MSLIIDPRSIAIDVSADSAKPAVFLGNSDVIVCHLTQGFDPTLIDKPVPMGPALTAVGHARVTGGDPKGHLFGFLQIARVDFAANFYAGRTPKEGTVGLVFSEPPALTQAVLLDADPGALPFAGVPQPPKLPVAEVKMGDHPRFKVARDVFNTTTRAPNFLFQVFYEISFVTVLTVQRPNGTFQHLAHFPWSVHYAFRFRWHGTTAFLAKSIAPDFDPISPEQGPPRDPAFLPLLSSPVPPLANDALDSAKLQSLAAGSLNRTETTDWLPNVPPDFFT
jgi:hypothetical protein